MPLEEWKRKKDAEKDRKGKAYMAQDIKEEKEEKNMSGGQVAGFAGCALIAGILNSAIVIDSGATNPFIKDKHLLSNLVELPSPMPIKVGDGKFVHATHKGRLSFDRIYFDNAYYIPAMVHNLLSGQRLGPSSIGAEWRLSKVDGARLVDKEGRVLLKGKSDPTAQLWISKDQPVRTTSLHHIALSAQEEADQQGQRLLEWHRRLGHVDMKLVWDLGVAGSLGGKGWEGSFERVACMGCLQGKMRRSASSANPEQAMKPLVNISIDLWGPSSIRSRQGYY